MATAPTLPVFGRLIGPSGSGKTTTIRLLTGGLDPTEGTVSVLGEDPRHYRRRTRERIGYMPQLFTLYPELTARENVDFVASLFGLLLFRRARQVERVLRLVDLWHVRGRRAGRMSGGMQRRLEPACALVHDPLLALLDEPTAGVDPILRASIWTELRRLRDDVYGPAVIALVLQHMALTLVALSLVKERTSGVAELFRIAPVTPLEVVVAKLLAFGVLGGGIALVTMGVMVLFVGIPLLADPWLVAGIIGLLIAVVSDSESQAVQLSLFVLLASVFFSGLILPVAEFIQPVRTLAYALPVTNAIALLQDLMLQGRTNAWWQAGVLGGIAVATPLLSWLLLRRSLRRA